MKNAIYVTAALLSGAAHASDQQDVEMLESSSDLSSESTPSYQRIQIAGTIRRDAERYLAGADMTRALHLRVEQLKIEHVELESDELVVYAFDDAIATLTEAENESE
jgi:hypothetical protein